MAAPGRNAGVVGASRRCSPSDLGRLFRFTQPHRRGRIELPTKDDLSFDPNAYLPDFAESIRGLDSELRAWIEDAPDEYLTCRDWGHRWPKARSKWVSEYDDNHGDYIVLRRANCERCGMRRTQRKTLTNYALSTKYDPPISDQNPGRSAYYLPPGVGRLSKEDLQAYEIATQVGGIPKPRRKSGKRSRK